MNNTVCPSSVRDPVYFFEDGNCVLSVEGVLFNLHRTILRRNSEFFRSLLSLPRPENVIADGESSDRPIVCHDSAETFRAWCSALYSGLNDISVKSLDEEKVAHVGLIAHKYQCDAIEMWARETTRERFQPKPDNNGSIGGENSSACPEYLLHVAKECNWPSNIVTILEAQILAKISEETPHQLRDVIKFAGNTGNERLKAKAYYHFLRCHKWSLSPREHVGQGSVDTTFSLNETSSQVWWDPLEFLTDYQKLRLHRGLVGLSTLLDRLRNMPMVNTNCSCVGLLKKQWAQEAEAAFDDDNLNDPKEFIVAVTEQINFNCKHNGACGKLELKHQVDKFLSDFDDNLVAFFPEHL